MSRILIADDDKDLIEGLRWYLEAEGFTVTVVNDGDSAVSTARAESPDVAILDIMMPGIDGMEVCRTLRAESDLYIVMLSARDGEIDKVRALSIGADDYVTKPFHVSELVARVKALLRRPRTTVKEETAVYRWKDLSVFFDERRVTVGATPVDLTAMEFNLLAAMVKRPRAAFPRKQLVEVIWGEDFYGELRLVDNHVYRLREKLSKAGLRDFPVVAIRGVGYAYRPDD